MRTRLICLGMASLVLAIAAACSSARSTGDDSSNRPPPRTSASYQLAPGETVTLAPTVTLKLERVNDSRCKKSTVCVWAGYISYSFILSDQQGQTSFLLAQDMPGAHTSLTRKGLTFTLQGLQPAESGAPNYRVSLRVNISQPT